MKLLRHKEHRGSRGFIRVLAAMMFCLVLSIGTVCYADEVAATVTVASAKIRASADPSSRQLGSAKQGGTVSIIGQTTGTDGKTWYQVFVDANTKGFIRADLVNVTGTGTISSVSSDASASTSTTTTTTTDTQVSSTDKKSGTVQTNNVRIRKGASTTADVVATANRGMVVTVTGEAAGDDGKTWYQISFTYNSKEITGFIRSDLVTFDTLPADTAQTTINGTSETTEEPATEASTEEVTEPATEEQPQEQESSSSSNDTQNMILMNVEDVPYIMPEFNPIILKWEDQDINAYKNGDFYLFYAQKQNGEEGWYVFDSVNNVYERYVYSTAGATVPETSAMSGNMLPVIILAVIIVILLIAIILMFMKLREYTGEYEEYEDDEEDDEYGDEEEAEDEEEELAEEPARRPMQQPRRQPAQQPRPQQPVRNQEPREEGQPSRRPQQPVRRPQGEEQRTQQPPRRQEGQPARRPQQQGQPVRRQEGEQPVRRQTQQAESARPTGRQPQGNPNRRPAQTRPENQPQRNVQQGRKAKNFLDSEDDDMEFIDI
ncbi:MAG: SH3 domain-containing protein [Lachnospiraceae bacterium]